MPKTYRVNLLVKLINLVPRALVRLGIGSRHRYLLTVRGRMTGKLYSTPVTLIEEDDKRWLVAPYGEVSWVRNARAAGQVMLTRGTRTETVAITQVGAEEAAPVLKKYLVLERITQSYFDARIDSPVEAFQAEASRHPVFRIQSASSVESHRG